VVKSRRETKFFLSPAQVSAARKLFINASAQANQYLVTSHYFDTKTLKHYHESLDGLAHKKKYRLRVYNEDRSNSFWEIKSKSNLITFKNRTNIGNTDFYFKPSVLPIEIRPPELTRHTITIEYLRTELCSFEDERVTLDEEITYSSPYESAHRNSLGKFFLLEIKSSRELSKKSELIIKDLGLKRTSFSKYSYCMTKSKERGLSGIFS